MYRSGLAGANQDHVTNGGRLDGWASLPADGPGFTYLSAVSDAYRRLGVEHRRSVLFLRPDLVPKAQRMAPPVVGQNLADLVTLAKDADTSRPELVSAKKFALR